MPELTEEQDERSRIRHAAIRYLARREHSELEIHNKLMQKGLAPALIDEVIADLVRLDLISNHRFTESYIRSRRMRGFGPIRIRQELRERGVDASLIDPSLNTGVDWAQLANDVRIKKFGLAWPTEFSEQARQMRYLQYRGFNHEQINQAIASADADEALPVGND